MIKILLALCSSLLISIICIAETQQTVGFVFVHESAPSSKAAETFRQEIKKRSKGFWEVEILKTSQAMDKIKSKNSAKAVTQQEKISQLLTNGGFRVLQIPVAGLQDYLPDLKILSLPYLFKNDAEVFAALDGPLGNYLKEKFLSKSVGYSLLEFTYSGGFENLMSRDALLTPNNIKEYTLLVSPNAEYRSDLLSPLFSSVRKEFYKFKDPSSLGEKTVFSISPSQVPFPKTKADLFKSAIKLGAQVYLTAYIVDTKWLSSLTQEESEWVLASAREAAVVERNWAIEINTKIFNKMERSGGKIYDLSSEKQDLLKTSGLKIRKDFTDHSGLEVTKFLKGSNLTIQ